MKLNVNPALDAEMAAHPEVTRARVELAKRISARAEARTRAGETGEAKASHRVEEDRTETPPRVAAVAGEGKAWHYIFQEFGGVGFRPAPAPLRSSAKAEGLRVDPHIQRRRR